MKDFYGVQTDTWNEEITKVTPVETMKAIVDSGPIARTRTRRFTRPFGSKSVVVLKVG